MTINCQTKSNLTLTFDDRMVERQQRSPIFCNTLLVDAVYLFHVEFNVELSSYFLTLRLISSHSHSEGNRIVLKPN